ncbi:MAG TPA: hypothetical protein VK660_08840 [Xanthomonadaceae bacterium]|nr:hypothetical protein [Xanthomonadaceae bacterium]
MKLAPVLIMACSMAFLSASHTVDAACAIDDPVAAAQSFYTKHAEFSSQDPTAIKALLTRRFFAALDMEYKCAQGQECAIEADPWTDAQDGSIGDPITFATTVNADRKAVVSMTYVFILDTARRKQKHATLLLRRKSASKCWLVDDVKGPRGESLVRTIEKWHKKYGSGS